MGRGATFRRLLDVEEVISVIQKHYSYEPRIEEVQVEVAIDRIVAEDVTCRIDIPPFRRATMDGYAVRSEDIYGVDEEDPARLKVTGRSEAGRPFRGEVKRREAVEASTGALIPEGADSVVPVERTDRIGGEVFIFRSQAPGDNVQPVGGDLNAGEILLFSGTSLGAREIGMLAASGVDRVRVIARPRVAIFSTGDELLPPGRSLDSGRIYDVNSSMLTAAVRADHGEPRFKGILGDDSKEISDGIKEAALSTDLILLSGSTSVGAGDALPEAMCSAGKPGILVHGIAIKPGKPTIIGMVNGKFVIGLPGYPTSSLTVYRVLISPLIRRMAGIEVETRVQIPARLSSKVNSVPGRRYFLPVNLVRGGRGEVIAFPVSTGSEAVSTLGRSDGYIEISKDAEFVDEGEDVLVTPLCEGMEPAHLSIIGSHCPGVELMLRALRREAPHIRYKSINVGSLGGFRAIKMGEADVAGVHAIDPETKSYNIPFMEKYAIGDVALLMGGYKRVQGLMVRKGNPKGIVGLEDIQRPDVKLINRKIGSGTRALLDLLVSKLAGEIGVDEDELKRGIGGYRRERKTHMSVAEAILSGEADVSLGIEYVAELRGLDFIPLAVEEYDLLVRRDRVEKEAVRQLIGLLRSKEFLEQLSRMPGYMLKEETGTILVDEA